MKPYRVIFLITLCFTLAILGNAWAGALTPQQLWTKIQTLLASGHELAACRYIEELAKHTSSPYYMTALKVLKREHGISLENPKGSYTIKQMFNLQHHILTQTAKGQQPALGETKEFSDAWGSQLRTEYAAKMGKSGLQFRSAGPDRRFMTGDDYILESPALIGSRQTNNKFRFSDWSHSKKTINRKQKPNQSLARRKQIFTSAA